jgi:hypothetical protein
MVRVNNPNARSSWYTGGLPKTIKDQTSVKDPANSTSYFPPGNMIQEWNLGTIKVLTNLRGSSGLDHTPVLVPTDRRILGSSSSKDKNIYYNMENSVRNPKVMPLGSAKHLATHLKIQQSKSQEKEILKIHKKQVNLKAKDTKDMQLHKHSSRPQEANVSSVHGNSAGIAVILRGLDGTGRSANVFIENRNNNLGNSSPTYWTANNKEKLLIKNPYFSKNI